MLYFIKKMSPPFIQYVLPPSQTFSFLLLIFVPECPGVLPLRWPLSCSSHKLCSGQFQLVMDATE
jgi:hypothetical protein